MKVFQPYFTPNNAPYQVYHSDVFLPGNRTSARMNFGTRTSAQFLRNLINFDTN